MHHLSHISSKHLTRTRKWGTYSTVLCGWQSDTAVNVGDDAVVGAEVVRRGTELVLVGVGVRVWAAADPARSRTAVERTERIVKDIVKQ